MTPKGLSPSEPSKTTQRAGTGIPYPQAEELRARRHSAPKHAAIQAPGRLTIPYPRHKPFPDQARGLA